MTFKDIGVPLIIAFFAAAVAAFWPWIQSLQRRRNLQRIIRRELEEAGPFPDTPIEGKPWWEHATRRFIHEEFFKQPSLLENRDFVLSLNATLIYQVSQLWIALEKRDGLQWLHFLDELAASRRVGTPDLRAAHQRWEVILAAQPAERLAAMGTPTRFRHDAALARVPPLFEKRFEAYVQLASLTDLSSPTRTYALDLPARKNLADQLVSWYYEEGGGLLLSGRSFAQFQLVHKALVTAQVDMAGLRAEFSRLRTDLKIDLGVRQVQERDVTDAWPEEERW